MTESESQFDKLDRIVETQARENEEIKALISQSASQKTTLEIGGLKLQVPGVIPRKIRHDLARVRKGITLIWKRLGAIHTISCQSSARTNRITILRRGVYRQRD